MKKIYLVTFLIFSIGTSFAKDSVKNLPRYMSLKVSEANVRTGPGTSFPVKWIFIKRIQMLWPV